MMGTLNRWAEGRKASEEGVNGQRAVLFDEI